MSTSAISGIGISARANNEEAVERSAIPENSMYFYCIQRVQRFEEQRRDPVRAASELSPENSL